MKRAQAAESPKAAKAAKTPRAPRADRSAAPKGSRPRGRASVGFSPSEPQVDLLPSEVRSERASARVVKRAWVGVAVVAVLVVGGTVAASAYSAQETDSLLAMQTRTQGLLAQQVRFSDVRQVETNTRLVTAARSVGASTEIDWTDYLGKVQSTLPAGVTISSVKIDAASPLAAYQQGTTPLEGPRVATLSFTADSTSLPQVPDWLEGVTRLPGYVDGQPDSVTYDEDARVYTTTLTMHIDQTAWDNRYATKKAG